MPATIGPFEVIREVGRGGMGEVYLARDKRLGREVVLKLLAGDEGLQLHRLEREARALAALNHPNIAIVHGLEETEAGAALVLEYVRGATLRERLRQGPCLGGKIVRLL